MSNRSSFIGCARTLGSVLLLAVSLVETSNSAFALCSTAPLGAVPTPISQLLSKYPNGGGALVSEVRNVVATTSDGLTGVIALAKSANVEQRSAIGAGLGQAAGVCARPDPVTARAIQEAILNLDNRDVSIAYQAATGDRETGSVGGGGGGGGGLGGGGTMADTSSGTANNGFYANSTTSVLNLIQSYYPGSAYASLVESTTDASSPSTSVSQSR